jgi:hypothetical protein
MASFPVPNEKRSARRQRGSALVEFVLAFGLLFVPLFLGIIAIGLSLVRANQVTEVCRDAGHMYAYGVDMSQTTSQTLVATQLAQGLGMTTTGGTGVIYLSTITYIDAAACTTNGLAGDSSHCPNINQMVVVKRITIGNSSVQSSGLAMPSASIITSSGNIGSADYLTNSSCRAPNFSNVIPMTVSGQYAYVSEMFIQSPDAALWTLFKSSMISARSVF